MYESIFDFYSDLTDKLISKKKHCVFAETVSNIISPKNPVTIFIDFEFEKLFEIFGVHKIGWLYKVKINAPTGEAFYPLSILSVGNHENLISDSFMRDAISTSVASGMVTKVSEQVLFTYLSYSLSKGDNLPQWQMDFLRRFTKKLVGEI